MNTAEPIERTDQQKLMDRIQIVQNTLGIPLIEIEQLNPRIRELQGVMKCVYHELGGAGSFNPDTASEYEWEWGGGAIEFVKNPFARKPLGTGMVAMIEDDFATEKEAIPVPEGALSGEEFGYNRELLASHYGEGYWRIVDPQMDRQIQQRYRAIVLNKGLLDGLKQSEAEKEADEALKAAIELQTKGVGGAAKVRVKFTGSTRTRTVQRTAPDDIENHPAMKAMREQLEEQRRLLEEMTAPEEEKGDGKDDKGGKGKRGRKSDDTKGNLGS